MHLHTLYGLEKHADCSILKITHNRNADEPATAYVDILTAGSFAIVTEIPLLWLHSDACLIPHLVDLRHAEFRVQAKGEPSSQNSQVMLIPVPQIL